MALALSVSASAASAKVAAHRAHGLKASSKTSAVVFPAKRGRHVVRADAVGTERNGDADASVSISAAPSAVNGTLATAGAVPSKAALARARDIMADPPPPPRSWSARRST